MTRLERKKILWVLKVRIIRVGLEKLGHLVRVDVVRINRFIIARQVLVLVLGLLALFGLVSEDACPLAMEQLTSPDITGSGVAEVRAFKDMAIGAVCTLVTITAEPECLADGRAWRRFGVGKWTVRPRALSLGKMQAVRNTLWGKLMGEVACLAVGTLAVFHEVFAESHLVGVVNIAAGWAFRAGS